MLAVGQRSTARGLPGTVTTCTSSGCVALPTMVGAATAVAVSLSCLHVLPCVFAPAQDPACALSDKQRSVIAGVVQHAARRAGLATYGLNGLF
jgi:hypothetical protein